MSRSHETLAAVLGRLVARQDVLVLKVADVIAKRVEREKADVFEALLYAAVAGRFKRDVVDAAVGIARPQRKLSGSPLHAQAPRPRVNLHRDRAALVGPGGFLVDELAVLEDAAARARHALHIVVEEVNLVIVALDLTLGGMALADPLRALPRGNTLVVLPRLDLLVGPRGAALVDLHRSDGSRFESGRRELPDARRAGCAAPEGRARASAMV